jgi:murein DD-endopeptidase MepM/ murein hydrolase activator NlpD
MALLALVFPLVMVTLTGPSLPSAGPSPIGSGTERIGIVPMLPVGTWAWPVQGPVIRGFDPPDTPFGAGHRGIDIAAAPGTPILATEAGTVSFAGRVGGELFVTIVHGGGLSSTYSWISSTTVRKGDVVSRGQPIGSTGTGSPGATVPHLHFGAKLDGEYVDPILLLAPLGVQDLIRLVPILS